jgi:sugar/nucleoside kinase (ribokinase family)
METHSDLPISRSPIAIVGNINLDVKTGLIPTGDGIMADGESSVREIYESLGGGGANTALAVAHLGGRAHFFGCVGMDDLGDRLEASLLEYGITPHLARKPTVTGRSINLNWDNGCRHFISSLPSNRSLMFEDIEVDQLIGSGCRQLFRADVWFSEAMLAGGNCRLLQRAREAGIETYIDINWDPEWSIAGNSARVAQRRNQLMSVLPFTIYVHGNERELGRFTGCQDARDTCRFLMDRGCSGVVMHRGSRGAAAFNAVEGWVEVPASPVDCIVSSTGCGDVFCAAHMLLSGLPTMERLDASTRIAADHLSGKRTLIPRLKNRNPIRGGGT